MKIKIILGMVIMILLMPCIYAQSKFYVGEKLEDIYIEYHKGERVFNDNSYILRRDDNKVVYCLNPWRRLNQEEYYDEYLYNDSRFNISDDTLKRINLIAYYGYNYPGHEDNKWYAITQFLIWQALDLDDLFFTDTRYGNRIEPFTQEINEINRLINKHNTRPSFSYKTFNYVGNNTYIESDSNYVLDDYIIYDSNISSNIKDNKLIINTMNNGEYYIKFKRKREMNNNYILYGLDGFQEVIDPGSIETIYFDVKISVNSGTIIIEKKDSENINRTYANLNDAEYVVMQDNKKIGTITTDNYGIGKLEYLELGKYYIYEEKASEGYNLDNNYYYVNLTSNNKTITIKSYEDVIKGNIKIIKYYGENNDYELEDDAAFELYDTSDNLIKTYELNNGKVLDTLPYGNYYLKQIKGKEGYELIDKYEIDIKENKEYLIELYNERIKGDIKIIKYYGENNDYKLEDDAVFELYDTSDNLINTYELNNGEASDTLPYGNYYLKQVRGKEGYELIDKYEIDIKENKEYLIELYNEKKEIIVDVPNTGVKTKKNVWFILVLVGFALIILDIINYKAYKS